MEVSNTALRTALGIGISAIATEHFFSASLSSPVTVKELKQNPETVRQAYAVAIIMSLMLAIVLSVILKNITPVITTIVILGVYIILYERAIKGKKLLPV